MKSFAYPAAFGVLIDFTFALARSPELHGYAYRFLRVDGRIPGWGSFPGIVGLRHRGVSGVERRLGAG